MLTNHRNSIAAILMALTASVATRAETTRDYSWLTGDKISGGLTVVSDNTGAYTTKFHFNDRGRGPESTTKVSINNAGIVTGFSATGLNYEKGTISEDFSLQGTQATWQIDGDQKTASFSNPAFYIPANATPEYWAVTARALLKDPDQRIEMVAGGDLWINVLQSADIKKGGQSQTITLHEIEGPDTSPQYVWLDEQQNLFGISYGWFVIVREGWEHTAPKVKAWQSDAVADYSVRKSKEFAHKIEGDIIIDNARILDVETGALSEPQHVRISVGTIAEISDTPFSTSGHHIDAGGKVLMPGLWDMHAHIYAASYFNYIASGMLNIRDMANDPDYIAAAQALIAKGEIAAPDIHPVGFIDKSGPYAAPTGNLADTLEEALQLVDYYHERGYMGIKLYSSIDPDWIPAMAERAHGYGMKVMGHIPSYMTAGEAVLAGYDEITHVNMALLHLIGDKSIDTRSPKRFSVPGELAGKLDLNGKVTEDFLKLLKERGVAHDPTLGIFIEMFRNEPGKPLHMSRPYFEQLPPAWRQGVVAAKGYNDGKEAAFMKSADITEALVKKMFDAGITILPGTDSAFPGFALISELEMYVDAGLPVNEVLKLATIGSARHIGLDDKLGTVAVGKKAHLILVKADPTQNISALRDLELVIKEQQYFKPDEMLRAQGYTPYSETSMHR